MCIRMSAGESNRSAGRGWAVWALLTRPLTIHVRHFWWWLGPSSAQACTYLNLANAYIYRCMYVWAQGQSCQHVWQCPLLGLYHSLQANTSGYEEFSDDEITFGDDDFDQEVCDHQSVRTYTLFVWVCWSMYVCHFASRIPTHCESDWRWLLPSVRVIWRCMEMIWTYGLPVLSTSTHTSASCLLWR